MKPPADPGGDWTAEITTHVSTYDAYNWDEDKATDLPMLGTVTDEAMREMMHEGRAKEFDMWGQSKTSTKKAP